MREAISAALILREELQDAWSALDVVSNQRKGSTTFSFSGLKVWDELRDQLLAIRMPHKDWIEVGVVFRTLLELAPILKAGIAEELDDGDIEFINRVAKDCERGCELLKPYVVEGPVPFISPESVFDPRPG